MPFGIYHCGNQQNEQIKNKEVIICYTPRWQVVFLRTFQHLKICIQQIIGRISQNFSKAEHMDRIKRSRGFTSTKLSILGKKLVGY